METSLLKYFIRNNELLNSCDFNPAVLKSGPGIYEVFRIIDNKPLFFDEHLRRFFRSAKLEKFELPFDKKSIKAQLRALIDHNVLTVGNIRYQYIDSKNDEKLFMAWVTPHVYPSQTDYQLGVSIQTVNAFRKKPHAKRTNMPVREMAEKMIETGSIAEILMINDEGLVTECSRSNIFFIKNNKVYTPPVELVLEGITRDKIVMLAKENGIVLIEQPIPADQLGSFHTCFICSTSKNVLPVKQVDDIEFKIGDELTRKIMSAYTLLVTEHLRSFNW